MNEWISVEERLPEDDDIYWVYDGTVVREGWFDSDWERWNIIEDYPMDKITNWCLIEYPDLPTEDK